MSMDFFSNQGQAAAGQRVTGLTSERELRESKFKRNEDLGEQLDRLALITNAMWELLQQAYPNLTVEHLLAKMHEIDGRDGVYDGSTHRPPSDCPSPTCSAKIMAGHPRCQFCGTEAGRRADPFSF